MSYSISKMMVTSSRQAETVDRIPKCFGVKRSCLLFRSWRIFGQKQSCYTKRLKCIYKKICEKRRLQEYNWGCLSSFIINPFFGNRNHCNLWTNLRFLFPNNPCKLAGFIDVQLFQFISIASFSLSLSQSSQSCIRWFQKSCNSRLGFKFICSQVRNFVQLHETFMPVFIYIFFVLHSTWKW